MKLNCKENNYNLRIKRLLVREWESSSREINKSLRKSLSQLQIRVHETKLCCKL